MNKLLFLEQDSNSELKPLMGSYFKWLSGEVNYESGQPTSVIGSWLYRIRDIVTNRKTAILGSCHILMMWSLVPCTGGHVVQLIISRTVGVSIVATTYLKPVETLLRFPTVLT